MEREYKLTLRQDEAYEYLSNENDVASSTVEQKAVVSLGSYVYGFIIGRSI